nr:MAG TPA: hypothetical protein [Caudoviricetes sp.]
MSKIFKYLDQHIPAFVIGGLAGVVIAFAVVMPARGLL